MRDLFRYTICLRGERRVRHFWSLAVIAVCLAGAPAALAQALVLDEVRVGALAHSIEPGHSESGADLNAELLWRRPEVSYGSPVLDVLLRPRLHVGASINTSGDTNQVYAGFTWDLKLAPSLFLELTFGGAWHDGPTDSGAADLYGCAFSFRESASLGLALNERWRVYGTIAHMSNADLCDHNSGLTSVGVRLGYKLQ
jgi:hypothetical protein